MIISALNPLFFAILGQVILKGEYNIESLKHRCSDKIQGFFTSANSLVLK